MDEKLTQQLLSEQLQLLDAATQVLSDSHKRVEGIFKTEKHVLSVGEKESCEALSSRFVRLCDFLFQRVFRTLDQIELTDEGTGIDRLNRMEKRGLIGSAHLWRSLRDLRNEIVHEYLIEESDRTLTESRRLCPELFQTVAKIKSYIQNKGYIEPEKS